jgi:hypothetical protein
MGDMAFDPDTAPRGRYDSMMSEIAHITVSGDLQGDFVVTEERPGGKFVIERERSWKAVQARAGGREATDAEFAAFEAEHGPFGPPDGEG